MLYCAGVGDLAVLGVDLSRLLMRPSPGDRPMSHTLRISFGRPQRTE